jgi:predicted RNase H-like HicB family nuclease
MLNEWKYTIETEQETDGRWIAEILEMSGVLAYGDTKEQAQANVKALALRVIAEEMEEKRSAAVFGFSSIAFSIL